MTPEVFIDTWIRAFQYEMVTDLKQSIRKARLENSGDLANSVYTRVNSQPNNGIFFMMVFFKEYGRWQDMRRDMSHSGGDEMVQALFDWAQEKGLDKFARNGYADKYAGLPPSRILNAIAWGTIRKYSKKAPRKRGWYNKQKERTIERGYAQLIEGYNERVVQAAINAIQNP